MRRGALKMLFSIDFIIADYTLKPFYEPLLTVLRRRVFWKILLLFVSHVLPLMYYVHNDSAPLEISHTTVTTSNLCSPA